MAKEQTIEQQILTGGSRYDKALLVGLLMLTGISLVILLLLAFFVPYYGLANIHPLLPFVVGFFTTIVILALIASTGLLAVVILLGRDVPFSTKLRALTIKGFLPLIIVMAKLVGIKKEQVQHAFVAVNNELVLAQCRNGRMPKRILLLMPHCLQNSNCPVKITFRPQNCKRCGKCPVKDLLELSEKYKVDLAIATGGSIARRIVKEKRPELIIAVACERDLTSGIRDTMPLPVYGIFNRRPYGPCMNTQVDIERVEEILKEFRSVEKVPDDPRS